MLAVDLSALVAFAIVEAAFPGGAFHRESPFQRGADGQLKRVLDS
jgi:hypothetical protein